VKYWKLVLQNAINYLFLRIVFLLLIFLANCCLVNSYGNDAETTISKTLSIMTLFNMKESRVGSRAFLIEDVRMKERMNH
jgi:hypothetical protein